MSEIKAIAFCTLIASLTVLIGTYFAERLQEPDFVSPEAVELMYLQKGYSSEDAKAIREMCELKGCSVDEDGKILVNQN